MIEKGKYPVLEGEGMRNDAVLYSGNDVTVENFYITRYKGNGIMGQAGNNFNIRNNLIVDTGVYGIFPAAGQEWYRLPQYGFRASRTRRSTWACPTTSTWCITMCSTAWRVSKSRTAATALVEANYVLQQHRRYPRVHHSGPAHQDLWRCADPQQLYRQQQP